MIVLTSPHAQGLFHNILAVIAREQSPQDAVKWRTKILAAIQVLEDFPQSGCAVPMVCFETLPDHVGNLRQTICRPYRIVYEIVEDEVHVLSIRHARMLVTETDTSWN